jgi:hypothetical protein
VPRFVADNQAVVKMAQLFAAEDGRQVSLEDILLVAGMSQNWV